MTTLDKTDKDLLGPLFVRAFDSTHHLVIRTTLCRLMNYFYHITPLIFTQ